MKAKEARTLGARIAESLRSGEIDPAYDLLAPTLAQRTPFAKLGLIGEVVGGGGQEVVGAFLDRIAAEKTEGGWVVIGTALRRQLGRDTAEVFDRCRDYVVAGDVWYCADILAERVPGPALVKEFDVALDLLRSWRADESRWVRRGVGVAAHFWAKRSRGAPELRREARKLLALLRPMFGEWQIDAAKGVGWGLKTVGRHYPDLVTPWLAEAVASGQQRYRSVVLRKALTYLSDEQKARVQGVDSAQ